MPLVTFREVLPNARREGRAVGAFNIGSLETAVAVIDAAEASGSPVILQVYHRLMAYPRFHALAALMRSLAENSRVPVVVHLDHGQTLDQISRAIDLGFSSVMFDGSALPLAENIKQTQEAVRMAHAAGLTVEAEIGHVAPQGKDAKRAPLPTALEVLGFAREVAVDALAVAVGTVHGYYDGEPQIDVSLAKEVGEKVQTPLVLHGGSGTPAAIIQKLISCGFAKVNVATEVQHAYQRALKAELDSAGDKFVPIDKLLAVPVQETARLIRDRIQLFQSGLPQHAGQR